MFSQQHTYRGFQETSRAMCDVLGPSHVLIADIADFFPRLYTHRIDNALDAALGAGHMHGKAIKSLIGQWAGSYSYGIPVGSAAARLIAEVTIADIDQLLLSEGCNYVRYSDDFRVFAASEAEAYKHLTFIARALIENHGLTLQQHKTKIVPSEVFRSIYLKENSDKELETLSEKFHQLLAELGVEGDYEGIDYETLGPDEKAAVDQLNLEGILKEQVEMEEPDLALLRFLLRRLGQLGDADAVDVIFDNFGKFVPVVRETMEYLVRLSNLPAQTWPQLGSRLLEIYRDAGSTASNLEYSRMYLLHPFVADSKWGCADQLVRLFGDALDDFSRRELLLAMGRAGMDFWFRMRKQSLQQMSPWLRTAFIYGASCLEDDEYKHWIRGIDGKRPAKSSVRAGRLA
jgi:hypothetical protein